MHLKPRTIPSEIPTSSMADIAFLLVIYFMLTVTFAATQGLDLALPEEPIGPVDPVESVHVEVHGGGRLTVDGGEMALSGLLAYLEPKLRRNPEKPVIVRPAGEGAPYGAMVDVLDELRQGRTRLLLEREIQVALPTEREARFGSAASETRRPTRRKLVEEELASSRARATTEVDRTTGGDKLRPYTLRLRARASSTIEGEGVSFRLPLVYESFDLHAASCTCSWSVGSFR